MATKYIVEKESELAQLRQAVATLYEHLVVRSNEVVLISGYFKANGQLEGVLLKPEQPGEIHVEKRAQGVHLEGADKRSLRVRVGESSLDYSICYRNE